ncbi:hypothetical protein IFM89_017213 [Coptis chinensis]|uniref:Bet v I/Major latex protein domain-containing protein n=1 Tax=Coptis chinensis TaxID=261450 RepID=A0A835I2Y5_9MAGN|nr:hypothetical protein IFM89_017213 [Coptis chinensis]
MVRLAFDMEAQSSADKLWGGIKETTTLFPKIFPEQIKSIEVLEGDGFSVGTIRLLKYAEGTPMTTFVKEKIEFVDIPNKTIVCRLVDGEITSLYKNIKAKIQVVPKGSGSLVKWSAELEKLSNDVPDPIMIQDYAAKFISGLDAYLLKA